MAEAVQIADDLRDSILRDPGAILEDRDVMRALIAENERLMGGNIVDLRGIAMERLENRLDRLEDAHQSVIAAAYENLSGTNQIHRAVLRLLDHGKFDGFLAALNGEVAQILRVDRMRLVLETLEATEEPMLQRLGDVLFVAPEGFIDAYMDDVRDGSPERILLRPTLPGTEELYGDATGWIRSEALMRLDLGRGRLPGLLVMGSEDPHQFKPSQGTDLLTFFAGVFERAMRRWLS